MSNYQTILVHIDQRADSEARLRVAVDVARRFKSQLVGMYLDGSPEVTPSMAAVLPDDVVTKYLRGAGDRQAAAEAAFRRAAEAEALTDIDWRAPRGLAVDAAVAHSRCADLIVLGQPRPGETGESFSSQLVASVLMDSGRPLLVVPYIGAGQRFATNVLIAWDGGREAARAVADAMPLLQGARQVTVACYDPGASARGADEAGRQRLAGYLRRHGVATKIEHDDLTGGDIGVGDRLLSRVMDLSSDLIVMGGYGHSRWRERVLGGATRTLIATMTVPVLIAH